MISRDGSMNARLAEQLNNVLAPSGTSGPTHEVREFRHINDLPILCILSIGSKRIDLEPPALINTFTKTEKFVRDGRDVVRATLRLRVTSACWHWLTSKVVLGAGWRNTRPHQFLYLLRNGVWSIDGSSTILTGNIDEGARLLPTCGDSTCVNPAHRRLVANASEAASLQTNRGFSRRGNPKGGAPIIRRLLQEGLSVPEIQQRTGYGRRQIYNIRSQVQQIEGRSEGGTE